MIEQENYTERINLLMVLLSFEKYWSPYSLSDGELYRREVKEEAKKIAPLFCKIYGNDLRRIDNVGKVINYEDGLWEAREFVESIDFWANSLDLYPKLKQKVSSVNNIRFYFQVVLLQLESRLVEELQLPIKLVSTVIAEDMYHKNMIKWFGQIPDTIISKVNNDFINKMSETDTLVVVADIRRSQDLMTYGKSPSIYRNRMVDFMNKIRDVLNEHGAIFDRFTGDGFIAYFNDYMCQQLKKDYYEMMLKSCKEIIHFSNDFFAQWVKDLRKIPESEIGLSIGIDSGIVSFQDLNNQLLAIGDACVWATRMCSAGKKGEVIFNNIPYQKISSSVVAEVIHSVTKGGESFRAFNINLDESNYTPQPIGKIFNEPANAIN